MADETEALYESQLLRPSRSLRILVHHWTCAQVWSQLGKKDV